MAAAIPLSTLSAGPAQATPTNTSAHQTASGNTIGNATSTASTQSPTGAPGLQPAANNAAGQHCPPAVGRKAKRSRSVATWLGVGLATGALIVAVYYGEPILRLAMWTARRDFRESCMNDRSIGRMSAACNATLLEPFQAPPVKRQALPKIAQWAGTSDWTNLARTVTDLARTVTAGITIAAIYAIRSWFVSPPVPPAWSTMGYNVRVRKQRHDYPRFAHLSGTQHLRYLVLDATSGIIITEDSARCDDLSARTCTICEKDMSGRNAGRLQLWCGHCAHTTCAWNYFKRDALQCPTCGEAMGISCTQQNLCKLEHNGDDMLPVGIYHIRRAEGEDYLPQVLDIGVQHAVRDHDATDIDLDNAAMSRASGSLTVIRRRRPKAAQIMASDGSRLSELRVRYKPYDGVKNAQNVS